MFCQHCGAKIPDSAKFCTECGKPIDGEKRFHDENTKIQSSKKAIEYEDHPNLEHEENGAVSNKKRSVKKTVNSTPVKKKSGCLKFFLYAAGFVIAVIVVVVVLGAIVDAPRSGPDNTPVPVPTNTKKDTTVQTDTSESTATLNISNSPDKTDWLNRYSDIGVEVTVVPDNVLYQNGSSYVGKTVLTYITIADKGSDSLKANTDNNETYSYSIVAHFNDVDEFIGFDKGDKAFVVGKVKPMGSITLLGAGNTVMLEDCHVVIQEITEEEINAALDTSIELKENASEVFLYDFLHSANDYLNKYIIVTFPVDYIYSNGDVYSKKYSGNYINARTGDSSLYNNDNLKYATVCGRVSDVKADNIVLSDVDVRYIGLDIPASYSKQLAIYTDQVRQGKIEAREQFISGSQRVAYSELSRYPDTYKGQPLVLTVSIVEVEPDGWLLNGAIDAQYEGNEIVIRDEREVREPRLKAGDYLTIYAKGNGLTTIKTYVKGSGLLGSDLGADIVDQYEVPCVTMIYTELDRLDSFGVSDSYNNDDDYYADLGKQAADKFNDWVNGTNG